MDHAPAPAPERPAPVEVAAAGRPAGMAMLQRVAGNAALTRALQRDLPPYVVPFVTPDDQVDGAGPGDPNAIPDYASMTWQQLLPSATAAKAGGRITSIDLHVTQGGKPVKGWQGKGDGSDPTLNYADDEKIKHTPAAADGQGPQAEAGATPDPASPAAKNAAAHTAAVDAAIAAITAARGAIPQKEFKPSVNNNAGYDYDPGRDPAAKEYNSWAASALPTGVKADDLNWKIFQKIIPLEGQEGRVTTFDQTLSLGPGNSSSGGQTQKLMGREFTILPEVRDVALAAGLTADLKGQVTVVDLDKKWILDGQDAMAYLQTDKQLLSLLVDASQGTVPVPGTADPNASADDQAAAQAKETAKQRQGVLDAEFAQFVSNTMSGLTDLVKGWPLESLVLAAHAKHGLPGPFPFTFWNADNGPDLAKMVLAIGATAPNAVGFIATGPYAGFPRK